MTAELASFRDQYASALRSFLSSGGETGLESAYELGRKAVTGELGLLDLAGVHHAVLGESLERASKPGELGHIAKASADFFLESLSTFEMIQRGFREAQQTASLQREIALTLQRNLLPAQLPSLPGYRFGARYLAGGEGVQVGGDWYEVIRLSGDRVGVAVGDVVGRGVPAACVMGQLRIVMRAYALEFESPATAANHVGSFMRTLEGGNWSTCVYAVLDSEAGTIELTNAGHPPPLVLPPDGPARFLEGGRGIPLGVVEDHIYDAVSATLEPGSTVLLYTDGLVEQRGEPIDAGLERLRAAVTGAAPEPESLCELVIRSLLSGPPADDVAVLAVHVVPSEGEALELTLPAEPSELRVARRATNQWLRQAGATEAESYDITLATCEAAANAIEHAYGPVEASFRLRAELLDGEVVVEVHDSGKWRSQRNPRRGRGLGVMRECMDDAEVIVSPDGTTVRLRRRLKEGAGDGRAGTNRA